MDVSRSKVTVETRPLSTVQGVVFTIKHVMYQVKVHLT